MEMICYKDCLKYIIKSSYPNVEVPQYISDSWKSVSRAINRQAFYYTCEKIIISFPEHWEMNKWNCNNTPDQKRLKSELCNTEHGR